jgi:lysozyme family protein
MTSFDQFVRFVLQAEGAESNDPHDPGGHTRFGLSQRAHPHLNISTLTEIEAINVYRLEYWIATGAERLPPALAVAVADACVQHGARPAIRMLQHTLHVEMDGVLGPVTLAAAYRADQDDLLVSYCARRAVYYANLSSFGRFGLGWMRRIFALAATCRAVAP